MKSLLLAFFLSVTPILSYAEGYLGLYGGYVIPMSLYNLQVAGTNIPPGTTSTPIRYHGSGLVGGTLGYFDRNLPWLGIALYIDGYTAQQKNMTLTVTTPKWGPIDSLVLPIDTGTGSLRIVESDLLAMLRYPQPYVEPYGGIGVAILSAKRTLKRAQTEGIWITYDASTSTIAPGLNVRLGLRFLKHYHIAPFAEWKLTWSLLTFFPSGGSAASGISGLKGSYLSNNILAGLSYAF